VGVVGGATWQRRGTLAALIRLSYFALPLTVSCLFSALVTRNHAVQGLPIVLRCLLVLGLATVVLVASHRSLARLLPLAALLEVSVAFPGEAPSRYLVARDAGNVAKLREIVEKAQRGETVVKDDDAQAAREILALVAALRSHDSRTRGHSERVRVFTDLIAQEMQMRPTDRERLRWAALLHDVGKLKVPAAVLNKPGKLNEAEWDMIRLHPDAGARLAAPLNEWLGEWSRTIPDHHERFDGTGYPRGLAGEDISMGGRILAVADSFEVMTSARSYKKPMSREDALRELRRCSLAQFDPQVVRAMLAISAPKLRWAMGPLAWIASTPFALATPAASAIVMQAGAAALSVGAVAVVAPLSASAATPTAAHAVATTKTSTPAHTSKAAAGADPTVIPTPHPSATNTAPKAATKAKLPTASKPPKTVTKTPPTPRPTKTAVKPAPAPKPTKAATPGKGSKPPKKPKPGH
jgi:putative nucleotidyltransferase with HDIG domain